MAFKTRHVDGTCFTSRKPGHWVSDTWPTIHIVRMMAGTTHEQWEAYFGDCSKDACSYDEMVAFDWSFANCCRDAVAEWNRRRLAKCSVCGKSMDDGTPTTANGGKPAHVRCALKVSVTQLEKAGLR